MKHRAILWACVLWGAVGFAQTPASGPAQAELPPIDAAAIARRVVGSLKPAPGERAVIVYDPTYYPELARAIQSELHRAGVYPIVALTFDPPEIVRGLEADPAAEAKGADDVVALLRPVFEKSDIFLWLPARQLSSDLRWERLVGGSRVRGIHFHWILPLEGKSAEEIRVRSQMYQRAILETDYAALSREQDRLIGALRGQTVHIAAPGGTDLRLRVPANAWFHKNDGDISPARARLATSARDREMEFPSGALRFIPDAASAEGQLVLPRVPTPAGVAEGVMLTFEHGRVVRWQAEKNEAAFRALWQSYGGDIDKVGEVVLGTSPLLVASLPSGELPYYGYGAGYLRISMGDNWESGGTLRSPSGRPLWLFLEHATLEAGGKVLVRHSRIEH